MGDKVLEELENIPDSREEKRWTLVEALTAEVTKEKKNRKITTVTILIVIIIAIVTVALFLFFKGRDETDSLNALRSQLKEARRTDDSLKASYIDIGVHLSELNDQMGIQDGLTKKHERELSQISKQYEKVRNDIIALPFDQRMRLFAEWLSELDSNSRR